jgi:hypothetical protein
VCAPWLLLDRPGGAVRDGDPWEGDAAGAVVAVADEDDPEAVEDVELVAGRPGSELLVAGRAGAAAATATVEATVVRPVVPAGFDPAVIDEFGGAGRGTPALRVAVWPGPGASDDPGRTCPPDGRATGDISLGSDTPVRRLTTTAPRQTTSTATNPRMPTVVTRARRPESSTKTAPRFACLPNASTPSEIGRLYLVRSRVRSGEEGFRSQSVGRRDSVTTIATIWTATSRFT